MFKFKVTYIHNGTITSNILENDCIALLFEHGNVKPNNLDHYIILEKVYRIAKVKL